MDMKPELFNEAVLLNVIWQVHEDNKQAMELIGSIAPDLDKDHELTLAPDQLRELLGRLADKQQTMDAILHIVRQFFCKEADEYAKGLTLDESLEIKEKIRDSEPWKKMFIIVNETEEERTQRFLLEMLGIHE